VVLRPPASRYLRAVLALCSLLTASAGTATAEESSAEWRPRSEFAGKFDWIQMKSGEWVKGKIIVMYDGDLEFDSDEFDTLILDWNKIKQIRTSQVVNVGLLRRRSVVGKLVLVEDKVVVYGDQVEEFETREVLTITAGAPKEINFWAMKVFAGVIVRTGNTDVGEFNVQADFKRRTTRNRIILDFILNENTTDGVEVSSNQRVSTKWDTFLNDRLFVTPIYAEYFRDPFQNIGARYSVGLGVGYQLMDSPKVDWAISGGPAYQETRFDSVSAGQDDTESSPALGFGTSADWDITKWLELDGSYRIQVVNEASGTYNHHLVVSFEMEITKLIDFDVSWIWDRIQDPRQDVNGITPEQDDFRTTVGLAFEF
jgi:hypothetical protein